MSVEDETNVPVVPAPSAPAAHQLAVFRNPRFLRYWLSRVFASFAAQIVSVAVGWQIFALTHDALDLGLVGLCQFLPSLLLVLVTGSAADRYSRRRIMGSAIFLEALGSLAFLVMTYRGLGSPAPVFVVLVGFGVARAFFGPASSALVVNLVEREDLAGAIAWNSSAWQLASILGPVAGGILYGVSPMGAYATAFVLFFAAAVLVMSIRAPERPTGNEPPSLQTIVAGFRFIWSEKVVLGAISLDLFAVLLGGAVALMPIYADEILAVGPTGLGMLRAAPGIGAILTVIVLTRHPVRDHAGLIMFFFVGLFGAFTILFGLSTAPWLSILALALLGASDMISVYIRETLLQLWTPDEVRGRVNAVNMVFVGASNELGEFRAGVMASYIGAVAAVVLGGVATVGVALAWSQLFPELRKAKHLASRR